MRSDVNILMVEGATESEIKDAVTDLMDCCFPRAIPALGTLSSTSSDSNSTSFDPTPTSFDLTPASSHPDRFRGPSLVVINKCDKVTDIDTLQRADYSSFGSPVVFVSCKQGNGLHAFSELLADIVSNLLVLGV